MIAVASNSRTKIFGPRRQDTILRFILLTFGMFITWGLLINLLQVNFDITNLYPTPGNHITQEMPYDEESTGTTEPTPSPPLPQTVSHTLLNLLEGKPKTTLYTIKKGDSLAKLFSKTDVAPETLLSIEDLPQFYNYAHKLTPGEKVKMIIGPRHRLEQLIFSLPDNNLLIVKHINHHYTSRIIHHDIIEKTKTNQTIIHDSLYQSAKQNGLDSNLIVGLTHIFDPKINFKKEIHAGDRFKILYVEQYKNGNAIKSGPILAAQIISKEKIFTAFRSIDAKGHISYYTSNGNNLQKAFLRTPVHYVYISSPFNLHRIHPILHILRPHYGVDLAANRGTPIHAASDGIIQFEGRRGGYGNVIIIRHSQKYSTRYAHMERFAKKLKRGSHVKEGEIIGYVGMTGLATGPHLHYEFRINGKAVNPMTVKLPQAAPIPKSQRTQFLQYASYIERKFFKERNKLADRAAIEATNKGKKGSATPKELNTKH